MAPPARIVLDVSGLKATSKAAFQTLGSWAELVVTGEFFAEIFTHKQMGKHPGPEDPGSVLQEAFGFLRTAASVARLIVFDDPARFEIEHGLPGSEADLGEWETPSGHIPFNDQDHRMMKEVESEFRRLTCFTHPPGTEVHLDYLRGIQADQFWLSLSTMLSKPSGIEMIREVALERGKTQASTLGWCLSPGFVPGPGWFWYGYWRAHLAFVTWKYWAYGDSHPPDDNASNPVFDWLCVAQVAICDGILSNDSKHVLPMAWACWPEKRELILTYDQGSKNVVKYCPPWEKQ